MYRTVSFIIERIGQSKQGNNCKYIKAAATSTEVQQVHEDEESVGTGCYKAFKQEFYCV